MHVPVLFHEVLRVLSPAKGEFFVDATVDGGGHAEGILEAVGPTGRLLGIDWDYAMMNRCRARLGNTDNLFLVHANYADTQGVMEERNLPKADGVLVDLGFSTEQLEQSGRGFSFRRDEPFLMTYDDSQTPARELVGRMSEAELTKVLRDFGGERFAGRAAKALKRCIVSNPEASAKQVAEAIAAALPKGYERGRIHPATRTFQAMRILANNELGNLDQFLESTVRIVKPGGRVAIISFHSLEDRIVKRFFQMMRVNGTMEIITKKPIVASPKEIVANPASRSAKLRAARLV